MSNRVFKRVRALASAIRGVSAKSSFVPEVRGTKSMIESLEERRLFALLGIFSSIETPDLQVGPPGALTYTAPASSGSTGSFQVVSTVLALQIDATTVVPVNVTIAQGSNLGLQVNSSTGAFAGGIAGADLTVDGDITLNGVNYSGRLLEGEVLNWGWNTAGSVFDFRITLTGGSLMGNASFANKDLGIRLTRENVTNVARPTSLPNGFNASWGGIGKGIIGPLAPLTPYSSVSGYTYHDLDNDGVFDSGEQPIPGTTVTLTGTNDLGQSVTRTATTDSNGYYLFDTLRAGDYVLTETQPTDYLDGKDTIGSQGGTVANDKLTLTLAAGQHGTDNNFGEVLASRISGNVYYDFNYSGTRDSGESPISDVLIFLTGTDDLGNNVLLTDTTDANGDYSFEGLRPGTYTLTQEQPASYVDGIDSLGNRGGVITTNSAQQDVFDGIVLGSNDAGINYNFGEVRLASISGYVYVDSNNNGVKETGESPISNVEIQLTGIDVNGDPVSLTTTTNGNGYYDFLNLVPGDYTVIEVQPNAYLDGKDSVGSLGGTPGNDITSAVTLVSEDAGINYNFGEILASSLSGYVYVDANNDGVFQGAEAPIAGVLVTLTGTNDLGEVIELTATTSNTGYYFFGDLRPGTYKLNEAQPSGFIDGKDTIGTPGGSTANDEFSQIALPTNFSGVNNNFGEIYASSISGYVYVDANNDGIFQGTEAPISGVLITLTGTDDLGQPVSQTTLTNGVGFYSFTNLRPGTYVLTETQPDGYTDGKDTIGSQGGTVANDVFSAIALAANVNGINNNFGERLLTTSISGQKFLDITGNGLTADDTPLSGVTIELWRDANNDGVLNNGDTKVATKVTAAGTGAYLFDNLAAGKYIVKEIIPTGYIRTAPTNSDYYAVTIVSGQSVTSLNFANFAKADCACSLSNVYYIINGTKKVTDLRGNTNAGDTVQAVFTVNSSTPVRLTLVSYTAPENYFNANTASQQKIYDIATGTFTTGTYTLTVLNPSSNYQVDFVCGYAIDQFGPNGSNITYSAQCRLISADNDGNYSPVPGITSLSGFVYHDADNDGIFDLTETGIAGAKVRLFGTATDGSAVDVTVTTDSVGKYLFNNLKPGTYSVTETQPSGYIDGKDTLGTNGGVVSNDKFSSVSVAVGNAATMYNFGELKASSIQGLVYVDNNNNGDVDYNDAGIANVSVTLTGTDDLGNSVSRTIKTDSQGMYIFSDLRPGTYSVTEAQPNGYTDGKDTIGSLGGTTGNDVFSSIVVRSGNVGEDYNFGERTSTSPSSTPTLCSGMTATIGYWQNKNGQNLILSLNGDCNSKALGNWLAVNFPNLYGANSCYATGGKTNTQVAAIFKSAFQNRKLEAQAMAIALAIYVTDSDLAGQTAKSYGFKVSSAGTGAATINVGSQGSALGFANNSTQSVWNILKAVDARTSNGVIQGSTSVKSTINTLLTRINETGDIT